MLKLAGETDIGTEKIEVISYAPNLQNTGDLEAGTHTIVPTSRPAIGSAQYSKALTLPKPDDARLKVLRIGARLNVNIAGLGTATTVYCAVRVDVDDAAHELFNLSWTTVGSKLAVVDTHSANKSTIFDLLKDGLAHTFYFLFWADVASQATIDLVQLWETVCRAGDASIHDASHSPCMEVSHTGFFQAWVRITRVGTIGVRGYITPVTTISNPIAQYAGYSNANGVIGMIYVALVKDKFYITVGSSGGDTDLAYTREVVIFLRSEQ